MNDNHKIIVAELTTLDGVIEDPDGTWGAPRGGWATRQGPQVFAGDKFRSGRSCRPAHSSSAEVPGRRSHSGGPLGAVSSPMR